MHLSQVSFQTNIVLNICAFHDVSLSFSFLFSFYTELFHRVNVKSKESFDVYVGTWLRSVSVCDWHGKNEKRVEKKRCEILAIE